TRRYTSTTRPLSRIRSMTSARPLGFGERIIPPPLCDVIAVVAMCPSFRCVDRRAQRTAPVNGHVAHVLSSPTGASARGWSFGQVFSLARVPVDRPGDQRVRAERAAEDALDLAGGLEH